MGWVYPRVCGGTVWVFGIGQSREGLSPRVRGNHRKGRALIPMVRSIPACAGEPEGVTEGAVRKSVYPRVCGGTLTVAAGDKHLLGLSPRVRGNREAATGRWADAGSIPACAGEPNNGLSPYILVRVYPRVCGGTAGGWR